MKIFCSLLLVFALLTGPAFAVFTPKVVVADQAEITKMTDEKLQDMYMDTLVELEAIKMFHQTSGFSSQQYDEYRDLLKYRLRLLMEIHTRNLEMPQQMERL